MSWRHVVDDAGDDRWQLVHDDGSTLELYEDEVQLLLEAVRDHRLERLRTTTYAEAARRNRAAVDSWLKPAPGPTLKEGTAAAVARARGRCEGRCSPACRGRDEVTHHLRGRRGPLAHHPDHLARLCEPCHRWVHHHVAEARDRGLLLSRTARVEACTTCHRPVEMGADGHDPDGVPYCDDHCPTCNDQPPEGAR